MRRTTVEVINGAAVTRYNGNNQTAPAGEAFVARKRQWYRSKKITAWRKKKAQEARYERRYLGGE